MKNIFKIPMFALATLCLAVSCEKDKISPDNNGNGSGTGGSIIEVGYLIINGMNIGVSTDVETIDSSNAPTRSARTAPENADGAFKVAITEKTSQAIVWSGTYADIQAMTTPMELMPGRYAIAAQSPDPIQPVAWEAPAYAGSTEFTIVQKINTPVNDLVCTLSNIKTSVELSADLKQLFKEDPTNPLTTKLSIGETACNFTPDESRKAYFATVEESNTLTVELTGLYNIKGEGETPVYEPVKMTQSISNVKAGQWRKVAISIEHADDGNVQFIVTVETWVYDEKIDVDVMSRFYQIGEETIPDQEEETSHPDAPVVQLDGGHDITKPFLVSSAIFDFDLNRCNDLISMVATPKGAATVTNAYCVFESDNAALLAAIDAAGHAKGRIDLFPTNSIQNQAAIRIDDANRLLVKVNDAGMFGLFNYEGTHTVKIVVTDNLKHSSYTTMSISVIKSAGNGPTITPLYGFDFSKRYTLSVSQQTALKIALDITSATGITGFEVGIKGGNVLPDAELINLGLAPKMNLINPASEDMKSMLQELGFLPKDGSSIEGKTSLAFDISEFVPAMLVLPGRGEYEFKLTVTDASGTIERTIMLNLAD